MNNAQHLMQESIKTIFFNEATHTYTTPGGKNLYA